MTALSTDTSLIHTLGMALRQDNPVALHTHADGTHTVKPLGILSRVWHWKDTAFHKERHSRLAGVVARILSVQPRLTLEAANNDRTLSVGRRLLKHMNVRKYKTPEMESLKKQIMATKLGIHPEILDRNPGLQQFVEKSHIERYLLHYGHPLTVNASTGEVSFLKDKQMTPWSQISAEMKTWKPFTQPQRQHWIYGQDGVQHENMYEWTELKPFKKEDPAAWNHKYVFEVCACYNPESTLTGNHSWIRLKTPSGDVYSIGLYHRSKANFSLINKTPLRTNSGYLMQPDVSEFWNFKITTVAVAITEEIFLKMKHLIEEDKKQDLVFNTLNNNCLLYCKKVGALANIDLPTQDSLASLVMPEGAVEKIERYISYLPRCIQKVCLAVAAFFVNVSLLFLGANALDNGLNSEQRAKATPQINSFKDLFDIRKTRMDHPSTFSFKTLKGIVDWRERKIAETIGTEESPQSRERKIREIYLSLPPENYVFNPAS
ncbi:MAG: hypothetical protein WCF65_00745 [Parachlamydiaceae bacterium]